MMLAFLAQGLAKASFGIIFPWFTGQVEAECREYSVQLKAG
ncbi:MAG: hypothetical protein PVJ63_06580 [Thioalkalispiraceae bacterium]|jgi:hypothetical protein